MNLVLFVEFCPIFSVHFKRLATILHVTPNSSKFNHYIDI